MIALIFAYVAWFGVPSFLTGGPPEAYVECQIMNTGALCTIQHRSGGSTALHACWDMVVGCANGATVTGHACGDVSPQAKSSVAMPIESFAGIDHCTAASAKVAGVAITEAR